MQFQVPQFIETEDKVVGPFSIRQFIYVGIACLISAFFYFLVQTWLFFVLAVIFIGGALAISFLKVQGRPLLNVIMSGAHFYWNPQTYVWKADHPTAAHTEKAPQGSTGLTLEDILANSALHKTWQKVQTGSPSPEKKSNRQFVEQRMAERYQIFQASGGDRVAARRIDYR
jgi:PrgI family protein